jgi:hypothetical protein
MSHGFVVILVWPRVSGEVYAVPARAYVVQFDNLQQDTVLPVRPRACGDTCRVLLLCGGLKVKVHPKTGNEGPGGEWWYRCTLF